MLFIPASRTLLALDLVFREPKIGLSKHFRTLRLQCLNIAQNVLMLLFEVICDGEACNDRTAFDDRQLGKTKNLG